MTEWKEQYEAMMEAYNAPIQQVVIQPTDSELRYLRRVNVILAVVCSIPIGLFVASLIWIISLLTG